MIKKKSSLAILGGGQLARMMIPTLKKWDQFFSVLDRSDCVAAAFTDDLRIGSFKCDEDVSKLTDCEVVTFDLEDISIAGIKKLESAGVFVRPSSFVMETIQDKSKQKKFFLDHSIPSAKFKCVHDHFDELPSGFIKKCTGGYDGKGVFSWKKGNLYPDDFKTSVIWEEKVPFQKELSQIVARGLNGKKVCYEPVEMVFDHKLNLIDYTLSPAPIKDSVKAKARSIACDIADKLDYVGVLAVEMFLLEDDRLLVNELAPRPHNSGHHTIESCVTSQFENHLRAVLDYPLGPSEQRSTASLTYNILGTGNEGRSSVKNLKEILREANVHIHLYGKKKCRPGRKMGHITILGKSFNEVLEKYKRIKDVFIVEGV